MEEFELAGDIGLGGVERVDQGGDLFGAGFKFLEQRESGGIAKDAKDGGKPFELGSRKF